MSIEVWHVNNDDPAARERRLSFEFSEGEKPLFPQDYTLVARVTSIPPEGWDPADWAFHRTNHIDRNWFDHDDVEVVQRSRSTSAADVVVVDGKGFRCCRPVGWESVD